MTEFAMPPHAAPLAAGSKHPEMVNGAGELESPVAAMPAAKSDSASGEPQLVRRHAAPEDAPPPPASADPVSASAPAPVAPVPGPRPAALVVDELAPPLLVAAPPAANEKASDEPPAKDEPPSKAAPAAAPPPRFDLEALTLNMTRMLEEGRRALAAAATPARTGASAADVGDVVTTLGQVAEHWYGNPQRTLEMQARLGEGFLALFTSMSQRLVGAPADPAATPDPRDPRFRDPEWVSNPFFDFLKQAYLILADWCAWLVAHADTVDPAVRQRAEFYMRQIVSALAPSNFPFTNPELLRTTLDRSGANLARGAEMLAEDLEAGGGDLKIRQSDMAAFELGRNLAITPGKVIHQNALMQLIQYAPATARVLRRPVLLVPPWINKYYVLDLTPERSFVRWCVEQGLTVFVISWVNPDERHAGTDFADYMQEGPLEALDVIAAVTGEDRVAAAGYCVGGTLLAFTLAYMAQTGDRRIDSATFLTTQVDFTHAGDLKVFAATEAQVAAVERDMTQHGYLDGSKMAAAFNLLRPDELIWRYVVKNYLEGEAPCAFDLLYWNADATRMPAANHSYYLRNCYLHNALARGVLTVGNRRIDLSGITIPIYNLAARDDHIAPAKSVFLGSSTFAGPVRFVLAGAGHIAGVVNPPAAHKYRYFTGDPPHGGDLEAWVGTATMHEGSWWPDWMTWLRSQDAREVDARQPGGGGYAPIEDAPGSYVKVRS